MENIEVIISWCKEKDLTSRWKDTCFKVKTGILLQDEKILQGKNWTSCCGDTPSIDFDINPWLHILDDPKHQLILLIYNKLTCMLLYSNTIIIICSGNTIMLQYKYASYNSALLQSAHTDYNYTSL